MTDEVSTTNTGAAQNGPDVDQRLVTLGRALRNREPVGDEAFDAFLSERAHRKADAYWSCIDAAQTACRFFHEAGAERILDVGSGVGKFCAVASLMLRRRVWGLERRGELVNEARQLALKLGADAVFIEGTLAAVDPSRFDGLYFYNPFGEYIADDAGRYDGALPKSFDAFVQDVRTVEAWLRAAPVGTALVTYNGWGGRIPPTFAVRAATRVRADMMRLWVKEADAAVGVDVIEVGDRMVPWPSLVALKATADASPLVEALCRFDEQSKPRGP